MCGFRRLLFALAFILLGGATPLHASLGVTPQCLPLAPQGATETADAKSPFPGFRQGVPNYNADDRDYMIRTIAFEAPGESDEGKAAVAHVILNRTKSRRWGGSIKDVVTHPWQFEPWMTRRKEMEKLPPGDPRYQNAARIADAVLSGQMPEDGARSWQPSHSDRSSARANKESSRAFAVSRQSRRWEVKLLALTFLVIGSLVANQAFAEDVSVQPLTRVDCDKAALAWDENANVCIANSGEAESQFALEPAAKADVSAQPLTRLDCDKSGMTWNDDTNVCGEKSGGSATQAASKGTASEPESNLGSKNITSAVLVNIDKTRQKMTVFLDGVERYDWPVSTGRPEYSTPSGTYTPTSMNEMWYSKQWDNSPMPHSIFCMKDGHAIHGSHEVKNLGKPASHGCVRLAPANATTLFQLVKATGLENVQVVLTGTTPGGEGPKVASPASPGSRYSHAFSFAQPQRRGGFFRRLFGGP